MTIKKGDLVQVVRGRVCCGNTDAVGAIFVVHRVGDENAWCECGWSGAGVVAFADVGDDVCEISRLIKIDPPALPASLTEQEPAHAA